MTDIRRIAAVINSNAGKHDADSRALAQAVPALLRQTLSGRFEVEMYQTGSLADLDSAISEAVHHFEPDAVITVGGDGTTHQFMSRLIPECLRYGAGFPVIGIAPAGTMNVVPNALALTGADRIASFERTLVRIRQGEPGIVRAHALRINDRYGFLYGAGLPVSGLQRYNAYEKRGMLRAAHVFGQIVLEEVGTAVGLPAKRASVAEPFSAVFTCEDGDGHFIAGSDAWSAVLAGTIESIGLGSKPIYRARERPGCFHLIAAEHGFWGYAARAPSIVRGRGLGGQLDHPVRRAKIEYAEPFTRFVDGDMYGPDQFGKTDLLACGPLISFLCP